MDNYKWNPEGWKEYLEWVAKNQIKIVEKIIELIEDILIITTTNIIAQV